MAAEVKSAICAAQKAWLEWSNWSFEDRAAVFLKAADLLAGPWRPIVNAATMLGQSKTAYQAEIDSRLRADRLLAVQRPLRGAGLRGAAPLVASDLEPDGSPAARGVRLRHHAFQLHGDRRQPPHLAGHHGQRGGLEASRPALAQQLLHPEGAGGGRPAAGRDQFGARDPAREVSDNLLADRAFAGIHFTGSTEVFQSLWKTISEHLPQYASYPRIVGETGGKDFVLAHPSADVDALCVGAGSRGVRVPGPEVQRRVARLRAVQPVAPGEGAAAWRMIADIRMGDVADFRNFMGAVIDRKAFDRIQGYIETASKDPG